MLSKHKVAYALDGIDLELCCLADEPVDADELANEIDTIRKRLWAFEIALLQGEFNDG